MFVVATGYDSVEYVRTAKGPGAELVAQNLVSEGIPIVSIWDDADYDSRLRSSEPIRQYELPRSRSAKLVWEPRAFGNAKTPVARGNSRAASLSDRGRRGSTGAT